MFGIRLRPQNAEINKKARDEQYIRELKDIQDLKDRNFRNYQERNLTLEEYEKNDLKI